MAFAVSGTYAGFIFLLWLWAGLTSRGTYTQGLFICLVWSLGAPPSYPEQVELCSGWLVWGQTVSLSVVGPGPNPTVKGFKVLLCFGLREFGELLALFVALFLYQ